MNEKKSFIIHLDAYTHILTLPPEQRGELFTALFHYAINAARKGPPEVITFAAQCTAMKPETRMAFYFMADTIARDTEKWQTKKANYQAAAARRSAERTVPSTAAPMPFRGQGVNVYPDEEELTDL